MTCLVEMILHSWWNPQREMILHSWWGLPGLRTSLRLMRHSPGFRPALGCCMPGFQTRWSDFLRRYGGYKYNCEADRPESWPNFLHSNSSILVRSDPVQCTVPDEVPASRPAI